MITPQWPVVDLASLAGLRVLDGRAEWVAKTDSTYHADAFCAAYRLDGRWHVFTEDPDDGYRSGLEHVQVLPADIQPPPDTIAMFEPMVICIRHIMTSITTFGDNPMHYRSQHQHDVLRFSDESTDLVICEVGTVDLDDYYPSFVHTWNASGIEPTALRLRAS